MSTKHLLIVSRDPFSSRDVGAAYALAEALKRAGSEVTLLLVQNGVLPARAGADSTALGHLARLGVRVLAEDFSLRERGIAAERLADGVAAAPLEVVLDGLEAGARVTWH